MSPFLSPGTQKGDVYSFAIILHEIVVRKGTWGVDIQYRDPRDIIEAVLQKNIRYPVQGHRGGFPPEEHQVSSTGTSWRLSSRRISGIQYRDIVEAVLQKNIRYPVQGHRGGCTPGEYQVSSKGTSWRLSSKRISG